MIDKQNMRKVIIDFPNQFKEALEISKDVKVKGEFNNVIISGLGGSALPANILAGWLNHLKIKKPPIYIHRDYDLPYYASKKSLVICISYSGNTEETISVLNQAVKRKIKCSAITTNGEIEKICRKYNIPVIKIPFGIQPRSATGYLFTSLTMLLSNSKIIPPKAGKKEIIRMAKNLKKINQEQKGKELAKKLNNKIPVIYSSDKFKYLARIWKIKFNENSKIPAFYNYFPELNHNEMTGFSQTGKNSRFHIIILKDKNDHLKNKKRMKLFAEILKPKGIKTEIIDIKEGDILLKIFSTLVLGDWVSYYLALQNKIDPTPVKIIEDFKKKLAGMAEQKTR